MTAAPWVVPVIATVSFWMKAWNGSAIFRRRAMETAEAPTSGNQTAQPADKAAACSRTVRVAASCLSGG